MRSKWRWAMGFAVAFVLLTTAFVVRARTVYPVAQLIDTESQIRAAVFQTQLKDRAQPGITVLLIEGQDAPDSVMQLLSHGSCSVKKHSEVYLRVGGIWAIDKISGQDVTRLMQADLEMVSESHAKVTSFTWCGSRCGSILEYDVVLQDDRWVVHNETAVGMM